jgi:3-(3-hydroxy-phenyl)propionate hydroxylase
MPTEHVDSPLSTLDVEAWTGGPAPGCPAPDAPLEGPGGWLSERFGRDFVLLAFGWPVEADGVCVITLPGEGIAATRYGARPGSVVLIRPDAVVAARWHRFDDAAVRKALARAHGRPDE